MVIANITLVGEHVLDAFTVIKVKAILSRLFSSIDKDIINNADAMKVSTEVMCKKPTALILNWKCKEKEQHFGLFHVYKIVPLSIAVARSTVENKKRNGLTY